MVVYFVKNHSLHLNVKNIQIIAFKFEDLFVKNLNFSETFYFLYNYVLYKKKTYNKNFQQLRKKNFKLSKTTIKPGNYRLHVGMCA